MRAQISGALLHSVTATRAAVDAYELERAADRRKLFCGLSSARDLLGEPRTGKDG
jgi:hypothetical protein